MDYLRKTFIFYLLLLVLGSPSFGQVCDCNLVLTNSETRAERRFNGVELGVQPGDIICFETGVWGEIQLIDFHGTSEKPLLIKNCNGQVRIVEEEKGGGITIINSSNFRITGSGDEDFQYGIKIEKAMASGLSFRDLTTDFEMDHIEVGNVATGGVYIKTDPTCEPETWRSNFLLKNVKVHDNYIHNTYVEGFYIGYSKYSPFEMDCDGIKVTVTPHFMENVEIFNNVVENTGKDGIQVAMVSKGAKVHHNIVRNSGTRRLGGHMFNIIVGGHTRGDVYNNYVYDATGSGIVVFAAGVKVYNNLIVDPEKDGIHCADRGTTTADDSFYFLNNTIIRPGLIGIRLYNGEGKNTHIYNNLIVEPGVLDEYPAYSRAYIEVHKNITNALVEDNFTTDTIEVIQFYDIQALDFSLTEESPVIDIGKDLSELGVLFDIGDFERPSGNQFDIGAYEYGSANKYFIPKGKMDNIDSTTEKVEYDKIITPNGDGINDYWEIHNNEILENCRVILFNTYGVKVHESIGYNNDWSANSNGVNLPSGAYYFMIDCVETDLQQSGAIRVLR